MNKKQMAFYSGVLSMVTLMGFSSCGPERWTECLLPNGRPAESMIIQGLRKPGISYYAAFPKWSWLATKVTPTENCPLVTGIQPIPDKCCTSNPANQDDQCKNTSVWTTCQLFGPKNALPPGLLPFCRYEHYGPSPDLQVIQRLWATGKLKKLRQDAMAVGSTAPSGLGAVAWEPMQKQFLIHAGRAKLEKPDSPPATVRVAVLDTAATRAWSDHPEEYPGNSNHGYSLVRMANNLLCGVNGEPDACAVRVSTRLALPYVAFDKETYELTKKDTVYGGFYGKIGDLAQAIREEVSEWRSHDRSTRLVLNLSVAWDTEFGGLESNPDDMPPQVEAVYRALEEASCLGALVVAASGNRRFGPGSKEGPFLPAAWEQRPAPNSRQCAALYNTEQEQTGKGKDYLPLLYAVGGVRANQVPLANVLPDGLPRLLAYGDHAVVESHKNGTPTDILTGSSVSTLVLASTAGVVWHYLPSLKSYQVMNLIYHYADPLSFPADFCLGGTALNPCPLGLTAHSVHLCKVLNKACSAGGGACPAVNMNCMKPEDFPPSLPFVAPSTPNPTLTSCSIVDPCPQEEYISAQAQPWVLSQPHSDPCPPCTASHSASCGSGGGMLYVEISPSFADDLSNPTLTVDGMSYSVDLGPCTPGTMAIVPINVAFDSNSSMTLSFQMGASNSVTSSLYIAP